MYFADMIAIPDFTAGAMENWGLIIYRERSMLYEEGVSSENNLQYVNTVIAHELAHMVHIISSFENCALNVTSNLLRLAMKQNAGQKENVIKQNVIFAFFQLSSVQYSTSVNTNKLSLEHNMSATEWFKEYSQTYRHTIFHYFFFARSILLHI